MKLLFDANVSHKLATGLASEYPGSTHVRESAEECSKKGEVLRPPKNEPWGARTFDLLDPFGNTIFIMGPTG